MRKKEIDKKNAEFVIGALKQLEIKNAQFIISIALSEQNELMIMSRNGMTNKEIYQALIESARAVQVNLGGLILIN